MVAVPPSTAMPALETERLLVRPFQREDLDACHRLLNLEAWDYDRPVAWTEAYIDWSIKNYEWLAEFRQPPYGDRAVVLKSTGEFVGSTGFVPAWGPFDRLPSYGGDNHATRFRPEFGLYWATRSVHLRQGYASEAARALVNHAFTSMNIARVIATTEYSNVASQAVMRSLGMSVEHNPLPDPPWFQVVGVLQNTAL
jgi:ribosomal-protein-alanine N-acetyltransferase